MKTINLESGMPTVEQARIRLNQELRIAKAQGETLLKIIHGYGSTGKGGAIKKDVQLQLNSKKRQGVIREYVKGENFSPFDETSRKISMVQPAITKDKDYYNCNEGITIVLL